MPSSFVHLHLHSDYSLLDGALRIKDMVTRAKTAGMKAVALTDHGNMFGTIQHYKACKEQGMQAILGCEINVARPRAEGSHGKAGEDPIEHLVLRGDGVAVLPEYLVQKRVESGALRVVFPKVKPEFDHFRLVFRADDARRPDYEALAAMVARAVNVLPTPTS